MTPEVYDHAFDAWSVARGSVFTDWSFLTDPINLKPDSPKSFRDASALVFQSGEFLSAEDRRELIGKLNAVPSKKVERAVRTALSLVGTEKERILAVKDEIEALEFKNQNLLHRLRLFPKTKSSLLLGWQ